MKKLALLLFLTAISAHAQLQRFDYFASTTTGTGSLVPLLIIPGAGIKLYSCSGATYLTCSTLLTTYTDVTGSTACPTSAQVVVQNTNSCVSTADTQGNFGVWVPTSGTFGYGYTITVSGTVFGPYQFTVGGGSGAGLNQLTQDVLAGPGTGSQAATVKGINGTPLCTGFTPTNGQAIEYTTASSPNPCYTAATPSAGGVTSVSGAVGNRADSITPTTGAVVITNIDQQLYASQYATIPLLITACGAAQTKITVDTAQAFTLSGNQTFPSNCAFNFVQGGTWTTGGAFTVTFNGTVEGNASPHFAGAATVKFGTLANAVQLAWFPAAVGYTTGSAAIAGTDSTSAIQAAIASLSAGGTLLLPCNTAYRVTSALTVTASYINIKGCGTERGFTTITGAVSGSLIISTSASADIIDVGAGSCGSPQLSNFLQSFAVARSIQPTGTAKNISLNGTGGAVVSDVQSSDGIYRFYAHCADSYGQVGSFQNTLSNAGYGGFSYTGSGTYFGYYVDSADGNPSQSLRLLSTLDSVNTTTIGTTVQTAFEASGTALNDLFVNGFETAMATNGIVLNCVAGGPGFGCGDVHFYGTILDGITGTAVLVSNCTEAKGCAVEFNGGHFYSSNVTPGNKVVDIEGSTQVALTGNIQIEGGSTSGTSFSTCVYINGGGINIIQGVTTIVPGCLTSVVVNNSIGNVIAGNSLESPTGVSFTNTAVKNVLASNNIDASTTAITYDATSSNNVWTTLNALTNSTTVTDAGTNNNPSLIGVGATISGTWPNQTVTVTAGGSGTVTHTAGALTALNCVIGNGAADIKVDPNCSTDGAGNMTAASYTANGATPGSQSLGAGTGSIPALIANSAGFAGPVTGGTSYLFKLPATITAGIAHFAAPATADGVNESALTSSAIALATADVSGILPIANGGTGAATVATHTVFGNPTGGTTAPTFTNAPVLTSVTVGNNLFNTTGISTSGNDFTFNVSSANLFLATTSNATNVQIQAGNTLTLGALSGCLSADATTHVVSGSGSVCGAGGGNTTSTSLTNNTVPRANGANSIIDSAFTDNGTVGGFARAGGFGPTHLFSGDINYCPDTSGSGTAQVCNTVGNFTPIQGSYIVYSTTTANTGTGLTINVNGLSAKSVSKWMGSTTTLAANDVLANKAVVLVYDGTTWELSDIGNAPSGGGTTWNAITNPTGNQALTMGNNTTAWTFGAATGATTPMIAITDTASNTGTGPVMKISTAVSSQGFPMQLFQRGTSIFTVGATGGGTGSGFAGSLFVNATTNAQAAGLYVGGQGVYAVGTSFFATLASASTSFEMATYNTAQTTGTGSGITFDAQNSSFAPIAIAGISGVLTATAGVNLTGDMVFCTSNNTACIEQMRLKAAGNLVVVGTVTSNLGTAAITSATPAAGVTSATCATAACMVSRGTYTVVGGTGTTGTFVTLLWPTTTTAWACSVVMNGGTGFLGLGHSVATATGMTVSAGVTILGTTFSFDYECQP